MEIIEAIVICAGLYLVAAAIVAIISRMLGAIEGETVAEALARRIKK